MEAVGWNDEWRVENKERRLSASFSNCILFLSGLVFLRMTCGNQLAPRLVTKAGGVAPRHQTGTRSSGGLLCLLVFGTKSFLRTHAS